MKKKMIWMTVVLTVLAVIFVSLQMIINNKLMLSLAVTFGTFSYHFLMRLITGWAVGKSLRGRIDLTRRHWTTTESEMKLYRALNVKKWKSHMPTYDPDRFDIRKHSWKEMAEASAEAEAVHITIFFLSYIPLLFSIPFGSFAVFLTTSIIASLIDLSFIVIQRFNRARIMHFLKK